MAASESSSSCGPQPNDQPPPPAAQAPKPTVVISKPLEPWGRVGSRPMTACPIRRDTVALVAFRYSLLPRGGQGPAPGVSHGAAEPLWPLTAERVVHTFVGGGEVG